MNAARGPRRLAVQIYLVTAVAILASVFALFLTAKLALQPPGRGGPFTDQARYCAAKVAGSWSTGGLDGLRRELDALAGMRIGAAAYAWDGALLGSNTEAPPAPLEPRDREALGRAGELDRGGTCDHGPCHLAFVLGRSGDARAGYLVVDREGHRGPRWPLLPIAVPLVGLLGAALVLGGSIARPLQRLADTARALGAGDLRVRTGIQRRDEVGDLARAFDDMAERIQGLLRGNTELLANVAHELRSPLARIRVALDLASDGGAEAARASLAEIAEDLSELEGLVDDILASARMDLARSTASPGAPPLRVAPVDLARLVTGSAERLRHRHPDRTVEVELGPDLPPLQGDGVLLRRALDNLLDNARKYSPPARSIAVRATSSAAGVVLEVRDGGEGIAPDDLERLFTPFFRADRSRTRATGGVGLGLTLARSIVEAHGGTLTAESTPGVGTTMSVMLPVR